MVGGFRDFNLHLPDTTLPKSKWVDSELFPSIHEVTKRIELIDSSYFDLFNSVNVMIFNRSWIREPEYFYLVRSALLKRGVTNATFTILADLDSDPNEVDFTALHEHGLRGVKFHSYVQKIGEAGVDSCIAWARRASAQGLFVAVDCSYGSRHMYDYDNLRLVARLSSACPDANLIILHSGGARLIEAMLLCLSYQRIQLEMSFSIPFYKGFSLFDDFAAAYRKVGSDRIIFGTDFPYVDFSNALDSSCLALERAGFSDEDVQSVLAGTNDCSK